MGDTFQIVYASNATRTFSAGELSDWMEPFREKNVRLGITGLLLYKHGSFMQALEGEEAAVRALFETIRHDDRHHHVLTLLSVPVARRQFPDWSMRFEILDGLDIQGVAASNSSVKLPAPADELSWRASVALNLLATFENEN